MAHLNKGADSDNDRADLADTMYHFDGTLRISVLDTLGAGTGGRFRPTNVPYMVAIPYIHVGQLSARRGK
jgi:hypothetical protein